MSDDNGVRNDSSKNSSSSSEQAGSEALVLADKIGREWDKWTSKITGSRLKQLQNWRNESPSEMEILHIAIRTELPAEIVYDW